MTNNFQKMGFEIVQAPDGSSLYVDVTLPSHLARVTIGSLGESRGYCDTEILDIASEEAVHWQHQEFSRSEELDAVLADFWASLRSLPSDEATPTEAHAFELPLADGNIGLNTLLQPLFAVGHRYG